MVTSFPAIAAWAAAAIVLAGFLTLGYFVLATRRLAADAERRVPAMGRFVHVDGSDLHYVEAGQGPAILFLHGLGGQLHHLRQPFFERLSMDFRVIAVDRPGSGYSRRPGQATGRLSEQAALLARFIDRLQMDKPLVVAHSLGGAVALGMALDHADAIGGLALISPLTHLHEDVPPEFAPLFIEARWKRKLIANTIGVPLALRNAPKTLAFVFGPQDVPKDYAILSGGLLGLRPGHLEATMTDLVGIRHDLGRYEARYDEIALPVGLLFGTSDQVLDHVDNALPLAGRIRNFELRLLNGVGHMPQFAATDDVEAFIRRMAKKVSPNAPPVA